MSEEQKVELPTHFYKYHRFDKHLYSLINNCHLWCSRMEELNDPNEGMFTVSDKFLRSPWVLFTLREEAKYKNLTDEEIFEIVYPTIQTFEQKETFLDNIGSNFELKRWKVCCFSTSAKAQSQS